VISGGRVTRGCLHALLVLLPLATSNLSALGLTASPQREAFTGDQFDLVKTFLLWGLCLVALGGWALPLLTRGGTLRTTRLDLVLVAFLGWAMLATVFSLHRQTSLLGRYNRYEGLITLLAYGLLFFLAVQTVTTYAQRRALLRTAVLTGSLVALYGVAQYLGLEPTQWGDILWERARSFSTLGNPELLGGYLVLVLPLALALALSEPDARRRAAYLLAFLLILTCLVTSFTRGAWIGGAVALLAVGFAAGRMRVRLEAVDLGAFVLAAGLGLVVTLRSLRSPDEVTNVARRLASIFSFGEGSGQTRGEIWQAALRAIGERPLLGYGPDTFRFVFRRYQPAEYIRDAGHLSVADNAHSYPLHLASAVGIPGAALFYGLFGAGLALTAGRAFRRQAPPAMLLLAGLWAAVAGYLVHLLFGLSVVGASGLFWVFFGLLMAPTARARAVQTGRWGRPAAVVVAAILALLMAGNLVFLGADYLFGHSRALPPGPAAVAAVERTIRWNPLFDAYRTALVSRQAEILSAQLALDARQHPGEGPAPMSPATRNALAATLDAFEQASAHSPHEYDNVVNLMVLYNALGPHDPAYYDKALALAEQALTDFPVSPWIRLEKANALAGLGRTEEAMQLALEAAGLDPRYAEPQRLMGDLHLRRGELEQTAARYRQALALAPEDQRLVRTLAAVEASLAAQ